MEGRRLLVDYAGTSPQVDRGINVVYNYTHAYTTYPLACAISPHVPNNEGSFRPVTVTAPEGSILNTRRPCAVGARHLIGHFLSQAVFGALSQVVPGRVIADGSAGLWNTQLEGRGPDGRLFAYIFFSAGGMGARPTSDGLSATAFPSGIRGVPAEAIESVSPTLMLRRALRPDSGGAGRFRGGLGQEMVLAVDSDEPALHSPMYDRTRCAARGFAGGRDGAVGQMVLSDGTHLHPKRKYLLQPGQQVTLRLPGGGGYGLTLRAGSRRPSWRTCARAASRWRRPGGSTAWPSTSRAGPWTRRRPGGCAGEARVHPRRAGPGSCSRPTRPAAPDLSSSSICSAHSCRIVTRPRGRGRVGRFGSASGR